MFSKYIPFTILLLFICVYIFSKIDRVKSKLGISSTGEGEWLVAPPITPAATKPSLRLRIVNFWAQKRVVSRLFIAAMVGWISVVIYQTGVVEHVITLVQSQTEDNQSK